jgi:type IV pilus assembly protein PilB
MSAIDIPPIPSRISSDAEALAGVEVQIYLDAEEEVRGALKSLSQAGSSIDITDSSGKDRSFSLDEVLWVRFTESLKPRQHLSADKEDSYLDSPLLLQPFSITLRSGKSLKGSMYTAIKNTLGIHVFTATKKDSIGRLFVPDAAVKVARLGELLGEQMVKEGKLKSDELAKVLEEQSQLRADNSNDKTRVTRVPPIGEMLVNAGVSNREDVQLGLARQLGIPCVDLENLKIDSRAMELIPRELAERYVTLPVRLVGNSLLVVMADPLNQENTDAVEFISNHHVELATARHDDIVRAIQKHYKESGLGQDILDAEQLQKLLPLDEEQRAELSEAERLSNGRPVVRLVTKIILDAIKQNASDIHIRPKDNITDLLYRIDGQLVPVKSFTNALLPAVVGRIKIIGKMDIAERRLPQDGRATIIESGNRVDLRISVIPTVTGESVVIRLLNTKVGLKSIDELGLSPEDTDVFIDLLNKSNGIILVTGPTGSGKSTTLYSALKHVIARNLNIITVENPVEYHIEGIEQIQVNTVPGYTFTEALRHILRHDPDVIMIGEIRDFETAKIAVESALTGHLVLSTLHTNDAPGAITRLLEMGIDSFLINGALLGVFAQRLVRRNCPHCLVEEKPDRLVRRALEVSPDEVFYKGAGCDNCHNTGYKGRLAVYELVKVSDEMRLLIESQASTDKIKAQAIKDGMVPLTENALQRAREKTTSLEEAYRVRLN